MIGPDGGKLMVKLIPHARYPTYILSSLATTSIRLPHVFGLHIVKQKKILSSRLEASMRNVRRPKHPQRRGTCT